MTLPRIAAREEWLEARRELLVKEKQQTRARDALNADRRNLPMVEVSEDYRFDGPQGEVRLLDLFDGRRQLIVYHFMFDPDWEDGCSSCTAGTDELSAGFMEHLHVRDTSYAMVSRAPLAKLERWKAIKGWDIPWYSSFGSSFNYDFGVTIDESVAPGVYNFRTRAEYEERGEHPFDGQQPSELPGRSCFLEVDGRVFHTYSQYARGLESTGGSYYFLDLTVLGRQEDWEEPKGRAESARAAVPASRRDSKRGPNLMIDRHEPDLQVSELESLSQFLDYQRATMVRLVEGLSKEQLAATTAASELTLAGLLKHLALVEDAWFTDQFLGGPEPAPWAGVDWDNDPNWEFRTALDADLDELLALYAVACDRSRAAVASASGLDALSAKGSRRDDSLGQKFSLRWIMLHLIEETARHLGHADLIRESIDGATEI